MDAIIMDNIKDFDLTQTFLCGQCFRWRKSSENSYTGIAHGKVIRIEQKGTDFIIHGSNENDVNTLWSNYFDLQTDYGYIKEILSKDNIMYEAIKSFPGIRLLRQELFEVIISFIISANNNIPRITGNIERLSMRFGNKIEYENIAYYAFPGPEVIASSCCEDVSFCNAGYRCQYIYETSDMFYKDNIDFRELCSIEYEEAKKLLKKYKGVGSKVADCILLFAGCHFEAFPVDVWVKRIMEELYIKKSVSLDYVNKYGREKFEGLAGYAQQYLFSYAREHKIGIK